MAKTTITFRARVAWWLKPAIYGLCFPLAAWETFFGGKRAVALGEWLFAKGVSYDVH